MKSNASYEKELAFQADRRKATTEFIKLVSDLWYDKTIEIVLFKNQVIDKNVSDIINLHEYAGEFPFTTVWACRFLSEVRGASAHFAN